MKTCTKCKVTKDELQFSTRNRGGKTTLCSWCKPCVSFASYESTKKLKEKAIQYKGGKCSKCGYNKCLAALEFHHIDPTQKDFGIAEHSRKKSTWEHIKPELDKCILLCSNCHRELHFEQSQVGKQVLDRYLSTHQPNNGPFSNST